MKHWHTDYLGLPWRSEGLSRDGISCWGLVRLSYAERLGVTLPTYVGEPDSAERREIEAALAGDVGQWPWREIEESEVQDFDLVTFKLGSLLAHHVGIVPWRGAFLHIAEGGTSRIERYGLEPWRPMVNRFLRYGENEGAPQPPRGSVIALSDLDPVSGRIEMTMPLGGSVADAVMLAFPGLAPEQYDRLRVMVGDRWIPRETWEHVRPAIGETVIVRVAPGDLYRSLLLIAITVAAIATAQLWLGPLAAGAIGVTSATGIQLVTSLTTAALVTGGALAVNFLFPPPSPGETKQTYAIGGFQNSANAGGSVPQLLGEMRFPPQYAVMPYSENVGENRFFVGVFLLGSGPVDLSDVEPWVGLTPLTKFDADDYEINYYEGYPDDLPLSLYTQQVIEEQLSVTLERPNNIADPQTRFTASDITKFHVELFHQAGQYVLNANGEERPGTNQIQVRYRQIGTAPWTTPPIFSITALIKEPFWRTLSFGTDDVPLTRGAGYEVEVTRVNIDSETQRLTWSALRSFRPEYPLNYDQPMALIEVRMRANKKLNGTLDTFNILGRRVCLDWDAGTETWIERATSNPASIARLVLQGPQNAYPDPDSAIDLDAFEEWHEYCELKGLTYNAFIIDPVTRDDQLTEVCAAGRAFWMWRGSKRTVVVDKPRDQFYDHIGSNNSWGFQENDPVIVVPDALAVQFLDKTNNYVQARRLIERPGLVGDPIVVEQWPMPGKTDPAEVWIEGRRRFYEWQYRPRNYTVNQDAEHLAAGRGDAALVAHPVIDRRQIGGRVKEILTNAAVIDEEVTLDAAGNYQCVFRRTADGTTIKRTVRAIAGTTRSLQFDADGGLPDDDDGLVPGVGDLALFYSTASPIREVIIQKIARSEHHGGQLTLIPLAPEIDTQTDIDALAVPAWDGRVGEIVGSTAPAPGVPNFTDFSTDPSTNNVTVTIGAGPGSVPAFYTVAHRLLGGGAFATVITTAAEATAVLSGYLPGQTIEMKVLATGTGGLSSAYSAIVAYVHGVVPRASSTVALASSSFYLASLS